MLANTKPNSLDAEPAVQAHRSGTIERIGAMAFAITPYAPVSLPRIVSLRT
jgi:hypothetical protein